jgi:putative oxidoreductase
MVTTNETSGGAPARFRARAELALRVLLAAVFVLAGCMKLAAVEFEVRGFEHFGYAPWFMYAIGVLELGAGLALLFRRSAAPAALLLGAVMVGAAASHLRAGDGLLLALPAVAFLALLAVVGAARRGDLLVAR